jgi:hypothetical protein
VTAAAHPDRLGRYEILGALASGGMAELFLARLPGVEGFAKRVVIKRVLPGLARDREFVEMFLAEARVAAMFAHQNIVAVHDIGYDAGGYFFAMELLHGADVGALVRASVARDGGMPFGIALEIARAACAGLHYAHERVGPTGAPLGLVHRDVSPQNLFVTFDGGVKLLDFGIAKAVEKISNHYTRSGTLRGKLPYMSPEQCRTEPLDRRSDVFSLAIVLWEMTVGQRLYGAAGEGDFAVLKQICDADAPRPSARKPGYPDELERIVMKALARDREERHATADAFAADLEGFVRAGSLWTTPREIAAYLVGLFPEPAAAWKKDVREETPAGGQVVPFPGGARQTVELPPRRTETETPAPTPAPPATREAPPRSRAPWIVAGVAVATSIVAIAVAVTRDPEAATTTPQPTGPVTEDAHWFQPDDYLISERPYLAARLDDLHVAKSLAGPPKQGARATFVDGLGRELATEHFWRSRRATTDDLVVGALVFCRLDPFERAGDPPRTKEESRTRAWTLARITEIANRDAGQVTVGNAVCDVGAIRVPID